MPIEDNTGESKRSPQLPLQIPSGRVHVYFVQPSVMTNKGTVERTVVYYTDAKGEKFKFMARDAAIREDLVALGKRSDLAEVDEEFTWSKGKSAPTIRILPRGA